MTSKNWLIIIAAITLILIVTSCSMYCKKIITKDEVNNLVTEIEEKEIVIESPVIAEAFQGWR